MSPQDPNFDGVRFANKAPAFDRPTATPFDEQTRRDWQDLNKSWWENSPMRYDWREGVAQEAHSREYFDEIDRRFLDSVRHYMPWRERPFEQWIPYGDLGSKDVLEIGVGQGTHAQLIAPLARSYTGIDLTESATAATGARLHALGIDAQVHRMDAEKMSFADASFDFVWSWGVIHHSSSTPDVIGEMARVLRPGGRAVVMVYHRSFAQYWLFNGLGRGILRRELWKVGNVHRINQAATDGALARFYSPREFARAAASSFTVRRMEVTGLKTDAIPLPPGRLKSALLRNVPDAVTRFCTDSLRWGTFLVVELERC